MSGDVNDRLEEILVSLHERPPLSEEELRFRIEPLRCRREAVLERLLASLDRDDGDPDLTVALLHELADSRDASWLAREFRDETRSERTRAEIAQLLAGVAAERLGELLAPEELARLSVLSLETFLERYRTRAGLAQIVSLYRQASVEDRSALLDAIEAATRGPAAEVRLGSALDPLFGEERDPRLRERMIRRLATRPEAASAATLARWSSRCHGEERRRVQETLRRLGRFGIRSPDRDRGAAAIEAWMSGVDGTGCYNVGLSFPGALGLRDVLLACVNLDAGLRSVSLLPAVDNATVTDIRDSLEKGQGIPVVSVEPSLAFRHVHEARRRNESLGRPVPPGWAAAAPYLERPLGTVSAARVDDPATKEPESGGTDSVLEHPSYGSWVFFAGEIPPDTAAAVTDILIGPVPAARPKSIDRRLRQLAQRSLDALENSSAQKRLAHMLRHQSAIHRMRGERSLAARAAAAAREIEEGSLGRSKLALRLMERSLRALHTPGAHPARPEVREGLKRRLETRGPIRRREVLALNLAEVFFRRLEDRNESLPPLDRMTVEQIERSSLAAAEVAANELTRDALSQAVLPGLGTQRTISRVAMQRRLRGRETRLRLEAALERRLAGESTLDGERARSLAVALATLAGWFAQEMCLRRCPEPCLTEPAEDGRGVFYSSEHPAGLEPSPSLSGPPNFVAGAAIARQLRRRLETRIEDLGFLARCLEKTNRRVDDPARLRRTRDLVRRFRALRMDLDQVADDPSSVYSWIEETHSLDAVLRPLAREVVGSVLTVPRSATGGVAIDPRLRNALRRSGLGAPDAAGLREISRRLGGPAAVSRLLGLGLGRIGRSAREGLLATLGTSGSTGPTPLFSAGPDTVATPSPTVEDP